MMKDKNVEQLQMVHGDLNFEFISRQQAKQECKGQMKKRRG